MICSESVSLSKTNLYKLNTDAVIGKLTQNNFLRQQMEKCRDSISITQVFSIEV